MGRSRTMKEQNEIMHFRDFSAPLQSIKFGQGKEKWKPKVFKFDVIQQFALPDVDILFEVQIICI